MPTTTKTIRRTFAVMDRPFTYEYYTKTTIKKGQRFRIRTGGGDYGYKLLEEGIVLVLGHGANEVIPATHFHLEVEEEVVTTTKKPPRRA